MKIIEFEKKVWDVEGVRVVLRANPDTEVVDYDYKYAANEVWSIAEFLEKRISKYTNEIPVIVIQGDGQEPHGNVILRTIRGKYNKL